MSIVGDLYGWQYRSRQKFVNWRHRKQNQTIVAAPIAEPRKVLFVVAGLLGDAVMSTPAIIAARQMWRNAHFTLLGQKHNLELLAACPLISEFYQTPVIPFSIRGRRAEKELQKWLEAQKFDVAIVLSGGQFGAVLAAAKIPVRVAGKNHQTTLPNCFTHLYEDSTPREWTPREQLNAARVLGYDGANVLPELWVDRAARETAAEKLRALGLKANRNYAVAHPFGSTRRQWWNLEKVAPLAEHLQTKYDLQTILIGGKETTESVTAEIKARAIDTTGQLNLRELLAVIDDARLVVTTDSGPFHIAGALRKTIVGLFRARRPEHAWHYPNTNVVFGQFAACAESCLWDCCQSNPCEQMSRIALDEVLATIDRQIFRPSRLK